MPGERVGRGARVCLLALVFCSTLPVTARAQAPPAPWSARDIGGPVLDGWTGYASGTFEVDAAGSDIWGRADQFRFVSRRISGDIDIVARVDSLTAVDEWSKAGLMVRASPAADAAHAAIFVSARHGVAFQRRARAGRLSTHSGRPGRGSPRWLRLVRARTTVIAYSSTDGVRWRWEGSDTIALGAAVYVGMAVTSHNESVRTTANFSAVTVRSGALPAPFQNADVGDPPATGIALFDGGTFTVHGAGTDIWDGSDEFHYVYQRIVGDVDVAVRVRAIEATHPWVKVGLMIRESLAGGAPHATALLSASKGYAFQRRPNRDAPTMHASGGSGTAPGWLRIVRYGTDIRAFRSHDGRTWTSIGSAQMDLPEALYVGLAVTSHDPQATAAAVVDRFRVTPLSPTGSVPGSPTPGHSPDDPAPAPGPSPSPAPSPSPRPSPADPPTRIVFQASADHATLVKRYQLQVFARGVSPASGRPVAELPLGKPNPGSGRDISVPAAEFFASLPVGTYRAVVVAIGVAGASASEPVEFTR